MARRRFNKNQPRDKNGRWTSGGGSARKVSSKNVSGRKPAKTQAQKVAIRRSAAAGAVAGAHLIMGGRNAVIHGGLAALHIKSARPVMAGAHISAAATGSYRAISNAASLVVHNNDRFSAEQRKNFDRRKNAIDKQVRRVERVQNAVIAGGYFLSVAGPVASPFIKKGAANYRARRESAPNSLIAGLKVAAAGRGGAYKISSFKGKRV